MGVQENVQVVKNGYAAFGRGDLPGLLALLAEDVEWRVSGTGIPATGTYRGRDGVAKFFQELFASTEVIDMQPREFVSEGDRVIVIGWERGKAKATSRSFESDWVMAFTVRDGKVAKFQSYEDTQALANAHQVGARAAV